MSSSSSNITFDYPVIDAAAGDPSAIRIIQVVKPCLANVVLPGAYSTDVRSTDVAVQASIAALKHAIDALYHANSHLQGPQVSGTAIAELQKLNPERVQLTEDGREAVKATTAIFEELVQGSYTDEAVLEYAQMSSALLYNHLQGGALLQQKKVDDLCARVFDESDITVQSRSNEDCNNPSFRINDVRTHTTLAILKQARNEYDASHKSVIQDFPLYHTQTHELIGYESDALLGFNHVPITCRVTCLNTQDGSVQEKEGILQEFVQQAKPFGSFGLLQKGGGAFLKSIDRAHAHMAALSGIIKGFAAGHMNNYVVLENVSTGKPKGLFEIDLKECMIPFNRMPASYRVNRVVDGKVYCEDLDKLSLKQGKLAEINRRLENERKSIVMARLCVLGLPQNDKPFEKAALLYLTHPSLALLMDAHHASIAGQNYEILPSALQAQRMRLEALREFAAQALVKDAITLTPRDVYFQIFGGKELYDIAMRKNYFPMVAFNNIVGATQRHELTDLSRPETMRERPRGRPASDSEDARIGFENLQALYG